MTARRVFYEGHVQGVGFRYATKNIARGFEVTGTVRNLPDGRVQLEAAAQDASELDAFLEEIAVHSSLSHHIRKVTMEFIAPPVSWQGFEIVSA